MFDVCRNSLLPIYNIHTCIQYTKLVQEKTTKKKQTKKSKKTYQAYLHKILMPNYHIAKLTKPEKLKRECQILNAQNAECRQTWP